VPARNQRSTFCTQSPTRNIVLLMNRDRSKLDNSSNSSGSGHRCCHAHAHRSVTVPTSATTRSCSSFNRWICASSPSSLRRYVYLCMAITRAHRVVWSHVRSKQISKRLTFGLHVGLDVRSRTRLHQRQDKRRRLFQGYCGRKLLNGAKALEDFVVHADAVEHGLATLTFHLRTQAQQCQPALSEVFPGAGHDRLVRQLAHPLIQKDCDKRRGKVHNYTCGSTNTGAVRTHRARSRASSTPCGWLLPLGSAPCSCVHMSRNGGAERCRGRCIRTTCPVRL
jgi:hypothetical protein